MELFIGTPTYSKALSVDYVRSVVESAIFLTGKKILMTHYVLAGSPFIGKARNEIVDAFLKSSATDLLFVDADVGFDCKVLTRILAYEQDVVAGLVPKRNAKDPSDYHMNALTGKISPEGLFEALEVPTAFMRIRRGLFDKIAKPYFRAEASEDAFGEDIYFCRKVICAGESAWIDSDIDFTHTGDHVWKGNFYEHCVTKGILNKSEAA
jgi:hypothetical protein